MSKDRRYIKLIQAKQWTTLRKQKLTANPLCERCLENGIYTSAVEVHHKQPVEDEPTIDGMRRRMYDYHNLESLCHDCHVIRHKELRSHTADAARKKNDARNESFKRKFLS